MISSRLWGCSAPIALACRRTSDKVGKTVWRGGISSACYHHSGAMAARMGAPSSCIGFHGARSFLAKARTFWAPTLHRGSTTTKHRLFSSPRDTKPAGPPNTPVSLTFWQKFLGPKPMPERQTAAWYREMLLICTVFGITGSSTMMVRSSTKI